MNFGSGFNSCLSSKPAENGDGNCAERDGGEFQRGGQGRGQACPAAEILTTPSLNRTRADDQRQEHPGEHGEAAGKRNGRSVNLAVAGIIHQSRAQAPLAPERQREQRREKRAGKGGEQKS